MPQAAAGGSEPSDAVRAVNALLTNLDALKRFPNSMVLSTSNLSVSQTIVDIADLQTDASSFASVSASSLLVLPFHGTITTYQW